MFKEQSKTVVRLIEKSKSEFFQEKFLVADSKEIFQLVNSMLNSFPDAAESQTMVDKFANFFDTKVKNINQSIDNIICTYSCASQEMDTKPTQIFQAFEQQSVADIRKIMKKSATKSCSLDPLPTSLLKADEVLECLLPAVVPQRFKRAHVTPLLKKEGLDVNILKNYCPVSNLSFISKVLERTVAKQLTEHLISLATQLRQHC